MRIIAVFISLCALSQAAIAETPACRSLQNPAERLACYDKASLVEKSESPTAAPNPSEADPSNHVDAMSAEDERMNERLRTICRGC